MARTESWHKNKMVVDVRDRGWYARRIEDQYTVGQPDLLFGTPFGPVLAEAKRIAAISFAPTPRQYVELERWDRAGGFSLLVGVHDQTGVIYFKRVRKEDPLKGRAKASECFHNNPGERFADALARFIVSERDQK